MHQSQQQMYKIFLSTQNTEHRRLNWSMHIKTESFSLANRLLTNSNSCNNYLKEVQICCNENKIIYKTMIIPIWVNMIELCASKSNIKIIPRVPSEMLRCVVNATCLAGQITRIRM